MPLSKRKFITLIAGVTLIAGLVAFLVARERMDPLTPEAIAAARQKWQEARIRNYRYQYTMAGSSYAVEVRDSRVVGLTCNGERTTSYRPQDYSVEGLFDVLEMELDSLDDPRNPFGDKAAEAYLRVRFHPRLGYVERYLRAVTGSNRSNKIQSTLFAPLAENPSVDGVN